MQSLVDTGPPPADLTGPLLPGLASPTLRGLAALQARWVDRIKRAALRQLHASAAGERFLLRMYLIGEETSEIALQSDLIGEPPPWLARQMEKHLDDERRHSALFSAELIARGGAALTPGSARPDVFTLRKIAQWRALADRYCSSFAAGHLVTAYAIGLSAEQTFTRVLQRHCAVLDATHPLYSMFTAVLADEERHVRLCQRTLTRLVQPSEYERLESLLGAIRAIDRAWGVSGALLMLTAGAALRLYSPRP